MSGLRFSAFTALLGSTLLIAPLWPSYGEDTVLRPEIGQALQQAQKDLSAHNYNKAIADVNAAEIVPDKSSYETYTIAQMKAAIAAQTGNVTEAFRAFDTLIKDPRTSPQEKAKLLSAEISLAYKAKNYEAAAQSAERYLREIGPNEQTSLLLTQAFYLSHNWPKTLRAAQKTIELSEKSGKVPSETQLQLLGLSASHLKEEKLANQAYTLLVKYYPKPEYWQNLIQSLVSNHTLSPVLTFTLQRLRFQTHNLKNPADLKDMVERSVQLGHSTLALHLLNQANEQGLYGPNTAMEDYDHFHNFITLKAQEEEAHLAAMAEKARSEPTAKPSLTAGYNLIWTGHAKEGLALMKEGLDKHPPQPEQALLLYALAQNDAGQSDKALSTLGQFKGTDIADTLAQLWSIALKLNKH
ncbi:hypothetical protein PT277_09200 [Acetobacteraceae bacterium ESL0709]|nr:hypothetical protein [Acetobacteraceae bacterium ESL0697]MDF7678858.1 hypothetical protein [Acetobacteraceae bacterium ESL0709]